MDNTLLLALGVLVLLGCATGFVAGLLGIGGGMLLVPFMTMIFTYLGFPTEHVVRIAIATALSTIVFTSLSSIRAHHAKGAVLWDVVKPLAIGALIGTFFGAQFASRVPGHWLALFFAAFVGFSAVQMLRSKAQAAQTGQLPGFAGLVATGGFIGSLSSLVGAAGGFLTVPILSRCGVSIHRAVATSAAVGFPIAAGGLVGYIVAGLNVSGLPNGTLGFVYWPAMLACASTSVLFAPMGARTAHAMPTAQLKKIFALTLLLLACYMAYKGLRG